MKHGQRLVTAAVVAGVLAVALALLAAGGEGAMAQGVIIYVDADAPGADNGTSWEDAFLDLQDALDEAGTGDQIWVAEGTYRPTVEHGGEEYGMSDDRFRSFQLENGVAIYGGFDPTVGHDTWLERDWQNHVTTLSGDLDGNDGPNFANNDENCFHVFYHADDVALDSSAILDGFIIRGGNADFEDIDEHYCGGGMINDYGASPALSNVTFADNWAGSAGGGIFNGSASAPTLTDCTFSRNSAFRGGGMRNEGSAPTMTGCTFTRNQAEYGGGVSNDNASPTLTDCTFTLNEASSGGGMANANSSPVLSDSTFLGNTSGDDGGGMVNGDGSSPQLDDCTFAENWAARGAGLFNMGGSSPALTGCTFAGNIARFWGGGMANHSSSPTLSSCTFADNITWEGDGAGIYNNLGSSPLLSGCAFVENRAEYDGGGVYNNNSSPTLTNCTFAGNVASGDYGGGMVNANSSSPVLTNCTFWGNAADGGGGMYSDHSMPTLTNCVVWGNSPDQISFESSTVVVNYCDVQGGYPGENNLASDPLFVDPGNGDFHLGPGSPCIDAGSNAAPSLPTHDFEGDDRVVDGDLDGVVKVDMGVDEVLPQSVFLPLVLRAY
jgi:parallel beta-helix repeat protein